MGSEAERLSPALEDVIGQFTGILRHVCWRHRLTGADADELVQEVRVRLWHAHASREGAAEQIAQVPASYIRRTARSAAIDLLRRRRARRADSTVSLDDGDEPSGPSDPDDTLAESELRAQVERAIDSIPASRRPVVRMHLLGHPREEIGRVLGCTDNQVRNLLSRGLADLRERLRAEGVQWTTKS
jgi:RNA polymerase sigma factor (sigma-70 family)